LENGLNKYKRLLANTLLFALSSFGSKILVYLIMPFVTGILSPDDYAIATNIQDTCQLLLPLACIGISNAVIRFGLDSACSKRSVFTCGVVALGIGAVLMALLYPALQESALDGYRWLVYLYIFVSCGRNLCSQFVRSRQYTRLYAADGILNTLLLVVFYILFLKPLQLGVTGYILATVAADFCSMLFLITIADLQRYLDFSRFDKKLFISMVKYSLPLVPASMCWWVTNASDKKFVLYMLGSNASGLYAFAYKIPNLLMLVSTLFTEAWQLSAIADSGSGKERSIFFSRVFRSYTGLLSVASGGMILLCQLFVRILDGSGGEFFNAWRYMPILIIATMYSCFSGYLSSIYMVTKKSNLNLVTSLIGAVLNLILNALLIRPFGVNGAAVATLISYQVIFLLRAQSTEKLILFRMYPSRIILFTDMLLAETVLMLLEAPGWPYLCGGIVLLLILFNLAALMTTVKRLLGNKRA